MKNPNRLPVPSGRSEIFAEGWMACEAGLDASANPYHGLYATHWMLGFGKRADIGFKVDHLPRKPSGAFDTARFR